MGATAEMLVGPHAEQWADQVADGGADRLAPLVLALPAGRFAHGATRAWGLA